MKYSNLKQTEDIAIVEGVNMNTKSIIKALGNDVDDIHVGWEAEFTSEDIGEGGETDWWEENGYSYDSCGLNEADEHPNWHQREFDTMYREWRQEQYMDFMDNNAHRYDDEAWEDIFDTHLDDYKRNVADDYFENHKDDFQEYDEDDNEEHNETELFDMVYDEYEDEIEDEAKEKIRNDYEDEFYEARDRLVDEAFEDDDDYDEDAYFEEARYEIYSQMGIGEEGGGEEEEMSLSDLEDLADDLAAELEIDFDEVCVGYNCASGKNKDGWYMETDGDGPELISPAMPLNTSLEKLEIALDFIKDRGETDSGTGLHVGVSIDGKGWEDYDLLKLAMFVGEDYLLKLFDRDGNSFTKPHGPSIDTNVDMLQKYGAGDGKGSAFGKTLVGLSTNDLMAIATKDYDKIIGDVSLSSDNRKALIDEVKTLGEKVFVDPMFAERYRTFNLKNLKEKGYIEFRIMGGDGYQNRFDEIKKTVLRYAYVMKLATEPELEVREYHKKLAKLFNKFTDSDDDGGPDASKLRMITKNFHKSFPKGPWGSIGKLEYHTVNPERIWTTLHNMTSVDPSNLNPNHKNNLAKMFIGLAYQGHIGKFNWNEAALWVRFLLKRLSDKNVLDKRIVAEHIYDQLAHAGGYNDEGTVELPNGEVYNIPPVTEMPKDPMFKPLFDIKW